MPKPDCADLLVGADTSDDACVYRLSDEVAIVQTVDFFPPMVDDPYVYGQIAAANALSDIYAMGAKPTLALNLLCFPSCLDLSVAQEILAGGAAQAAEAGCIVAGGHSITDDEPKYGLSVTGLIHPSRILTNAGARPGDALILTKAVGTGLAVTAYRGGRLAEAEIAEAIESMRSLNKRAAEIASAFPIHACTDVSGFGVAGHACEMAEASGAAIILRASSLPLLPQALVLAEEESFPGGMYRNKEFFTAKAAVGTGVAQALADIFFDPQTSGGLLFSLPSTEADRLLDALRAELPAAALIGEVEAPSGALLRLLP